MELHVCEWVLLDSGGYVVEGAPSKRRNDLSNDLCGVTMSSDISMKVKNLSQSHLLFWEELRNSVKINVATIG